MKHLAIASAVLLTGCATTPQQGISIKEIRIPTPVACVPIEAIPAEPPTVAETLTGNASADLPIVASSALLLRAWGREIHAALVACAPDTPGS